MASGSTLVPFSGLSFTVATLGYAFAGSYGALNIPVARFGTATTQVAYFPLIMPQFYSGGGITVYLNWLVETAVAGNVGWTLAFARLNPNNQNFNNPIVGPFLQTPAVAVPGTPGIGKQSVLAVTVGFQMNGIVAGDQFAIYLDRNNGVASNAAGFADFTSGEIRET